MATDALLLGRERRRLPHHGVVSGALLRARSRCERFAARLQRDCMRALARLLVPQGVDGVARSSRETRAPWPRGDLRAPAPPPRRGSPLDADHERADRTGTASAARSASFGPSRRPRMRALWIICSSSASAAGQRFLISLVCTLWRLAVRLRRRRTRPSRTTGAARRSSCARPGAARVGAERARAGPLRPEAAQDVGHRVVDGERVGGAISGRRASRRSVSDSRSGGRPSTRWRGGMGALRSGATSRSALRASYGKRARDHLVDEHAQRVEVRPRLAPRGPRCTRGRCTRASRTGARST